jgi:hypothetical protein
MVLRHRRGDDERARCLDVRRIVSLIDLDPEFPEILHAGGVGVTAGDSHPTADEQFGQRAHARASDAYEVDRPLIGGVEQHAVNIVLTPR